MEIQGLSVKIIIPHKRYSESFKKMVVHEYEKEFLNKEQLQSKYKLGGNSAVLQ